MKKVFLIAAILAMAAIPAIADEPYLYNPSVLPFGASIEYEVQPGLFQLYGYGKNPDTGKTRRVPVSQPYQWVGSKIQPQSTVDIGPDGTREYTPAPLQAYSIYQPFMN